MSSLTITLEALVTPEGKLDLPDKLSLPAGPVRVILEPLAPASTGKRGVLEILEQIHKEQLERGFVGRTREEIDADVNALPDEWEERMQEIERLQDEGTEA